ncbi:MAG: Peptidylprolyl isomerase, partial [Bacteroidota bacterium]
PFYSIPDSSVKIEESQLEKYLSNHKKMFPGYNSRSIQYVTFPVIPTKEDSTGFLSEIRQLAKDLATAPNDSAFAALNSDEKIPYRLTYSNIPENIKERMGEFQAGGIYGPFKNGNVYTILKYDGKEQDKYSTLRASHILIRPRGTSDSSKAQAKEMASALLKQIKDGGNFEALANFNSMDGSAQNGGDLGFFQNNGTMIKEFENAVFSFNGTGLLPNLVETEFGYHIVKVTEAKTNTYYKLATINKYISASQTTLDKVYAQADEFANANTNIESFTKALEKDSSLIMLRADKLSPDAVNVNTLENARDLVRWAYDDDTKLGDGSRKVFEYENQYIVAYLTAKSDKDDVKIEDYLLDLNYQVGNELKGEKILEKIKAINGNSLEEIAQQYGAGALVDSVENLNLSRGILNMAGPDVIALGKIAGLKIGQISKAFIGENGVFIAQKTSEIKANEMADYSQYKKQRESLLNQQSTYMINEAIKENANIKDNRYKFY